MISDCIQDHSEVNYIYCYHYCTSSWIEKFSWNMHCHWMHYDMALQNYLIWGSNLSSRYYDHICDFWSWSGIFCNPYFGDLCMLYLLCNYVSQIIKNHDSTHYCKNKGVSSWQSSLQIFLTERAIHMILIVTDGSLHIFNLHSPCIIR